MELFQGHGNDADGIREKLNLQETIPFIEGEKKKNSIEIDYLKAKKKFPTI